MAGDRVRRVKVRLREDVGHAEAREGREREGQLVHLQVFAGNVAAGGDRGYCAPGVQEGQTGLPMAHIAFDRQEVGQTAGVGRARGRLEHEASIFGVEGRDRLSARGKSVR